MLSRRDLSRLNFLDAAALAAVALSAGAELRARELRRTGKQVATLSLSVFVGSWLCVAALLAACPWALDAFSGGHGEDGRNGGEVPRLAALTLAATVAGARSPAAAVAVLKETNGAGPFCSLVMAVVIAKDALVFVAFAMNQELAAGALRRRREPSAAAAAAAGAAGAIADDVSPSATKFSLLSFKHRHALAAALFALLLSASVGSAAGAALSTLLKMKKKRTAATTHRFPAAAAAASSSVLALLPAEISTYLTSKRRFFERALRCAAVLSAAAVTHALAEAAGGEPLLACVAAGAVAANFGDCFPGSKGGGSAAATAAGSESAVLASPRGPKRSSDDDEVNGGGAMSSSPSPFSSPSGPTAAAAAAAMPPEAPSSHLSRERLEAALRVSSQAINVIFFSLAGASLRLAALRRAAAPAAAVAAARLLGVYLGSTVGVRVAKVPRSSSPELVWRGMVTQAGVALGLARSVAARFAPPMPRVDLATAAAAAAAGAAGAGGGAAAQADQTQIHDRPHGWGDDFAAAAAAVIVINMIVGPPLFRGAVISSGEVRERGFFFFFETKRKERRKKERSFRSLLRTFSFFPSNTSAREKHPALPFSASCSKGGIVAHVFVTRKKKSKTSARAELPPLTLPAPRLPLPPTTTASARRPWTSSGHSRPLRPSGTGRRGRAAAQGRGRPRERR